MGPGARLAGNYEQITEQSWYRDDPKVLADDLAYTKEFFAKWFAKGEGRLRPWVHNLGSRRARTSGTWPRTSWRRSGAPA